MIRNANECTLALVVMHNSGGMAAGQQYFEGNTRRGDRGGGRVCGLPHLQVVEA